MGWLIAQPLARRRDRIAIAAIAVAPDVDGFGIVIDPDLYVAFHHRLAHGAAAAVIATVVGAALCQPRLRGALLALLAFHSHVVMDLCGSGPGWPIIYGWPLSDVEWLPSWQWDLSSWQNLVFGVVVIAACLATAVVVGRSPVELFSLRGDGAVVSTLRRRFGRAPASTNSTS